MSTARRPLPSVAWLGSALLALAWIGCDSDETRRGGVLATAGATTSASTSGQGGGGGGGGAGQGGMQQGGGGAGQGGLQQGGGGAGQGGMQQGGGGAGQGGVMMGTGDCTSNFCLGMVPSQACGGCAQSNCSAELTACMSDTGGGMQNCKTCGDIWTNGDPDGTCSSSSSIYAALFVCMCGDLGNPNQNGFCG